MIDFLTIFILYFTPSYIQDKNIEPINGKANIVQPVKSIFNGHKDNLFRYQGAVLESKYNGDYTFIEYNMKRDIEDRDIIDVDRVFDKYVKVIDPLNKKELNNGEINYWQIKNYKLKNKEVKYITLYFHGMGGNRHQGVNDYSFGGNFNRIQNLMLNNNGVYITPDLSDFHNKGTREINNLIRQLRIKYPNADIILSGASSGGTLLWNIINSDKVTRDISGIILMGSVRTNDISALQKYNIPVYISHGTKDKQISYKAIEPFFKNLKNNNIPVKVEIFNGGVHGTPIRMTDWKKTFEWIIRNK